MKRARAFLYFVGVSAVLAFLALDSFSPWVLLLVVLIGLAQGFLLWRLDESRSHRRGR